MIINKGDDLKITLTIEGISKIRVFTTDRNTYIEAIPTGKEVKIGGTELAKLSSGVIAYLYTDSTKDASFDDGSFDITKVVYTDFYYRDNEESGMSNLGVTTSSLKNYIDAEIDSMITKYVKLLNNAASSEALSDEAATRLRTYTELKSYVDTQNKALSKDFKEKLSSKVEELSLTKEISDRKTSDTELKNYIDKLIENNIGKLA